MSFQILVTTIVKPSFGSESLRPVVNTLKFENFTEAEKAFKAIESQTAHPVYYQTAVKLYS